MHKKFSQLFQLGSRKGCNDSNLFDPFGCLRCVARHTAQALRLSLADSVHGSNEMNAHDCIQIDQTLKAKHVWPLDKATPGIPA